MYLHRPRSYDGFKDDNERKKEVSRRVKVGLEGHHIGRIVETVKMFLAIHKAGLPIWIDDAKSVRNRILALDNVGLLPEHESLHRGWQGFPSDFHVADVMHYSHFGRARRYALPYAAWKPLPVLMPKGK